MTGQRSSNSRSQERGATDSRMQADPAPPKVLFRCSICDYSTYWHWQLESHAQRENHPFLCTIPDCAASFFVKRYLDAHEARAHTHAPGHSQIEPHGGLTCAECGQVFKNRNQQQLHANDSQHSPFLCACGATFSRLDVLYRHLESHAKDLPKFPCKNCKRHRGKDGFRRRDHLVQHLRSYHKFDNEDINKACPSTKSLRQRRFSICPHTECGFFRDDSFHSLPWSEQLAQRPFASLAAFTKHMKDVHEETPFPCNMEGCHKVRAKGYTREKDLMKHRAAKHPDAPEYSPEPRPPMHPCRNKGCNKIFASDIGRFDHEVSIHWSREERRAYERT